MRYGEAKYGEAIYEEPIKRCIHKDHEGDRKVPISLYWKNVRNKDGLQCYCKICQSRIWKTASKPNKKLNAQRQRESRKNDPIRHLLYRLKNRAKQFNLEFDLKAEDLVIPEKCPVLGIPIFRTGDGKTENSPSVDRIDSSKGYTKDNVVVVSFRANTLKMHGTAEEHRLIYEFYKDL